MSTLHGTTPSVPAGGFPKFRDGAEWLRELGDVPLERVVFDPWPGTATEDDLLVLVERDKRLCELVDGTLVEKPVGYDESQIAVLLGYHLMSWILPRKLGAVTGEAGTMKIKQGRVRLPDVAFVSAARLAQLPIPRPPIPHVSPDLAVEVLSRTNTKREISQKIHEYFESGTRLVWIIDPKQKTIAVYTTADTIDRVVTEADILDGGDVLPGFTLPVRILFESSM